MLPQALESRQYSVMSYTNHPHDLFGRISTNADGLISYHYSHVVPDTPMLLDIAALQHIYGANQSYKTGSDTYTFDIATPFFRTIWDTCGIDTISVESFSKGCIIDLHDGAFSKITVDSDSTTGFNWSSPPAIATSDGTDNLAIAFGCVIENVISGVGNDILICNAVNNVLRGNAGDDSLDGGTDTAVFNGSLSGHTLTKTGGTYTVQAKAGTDGADTLTAVESLRFAEKTVNYTVKAKAAAAPQADVICLSELYVAFFNRVPDADGLAFWIDQKSAGQSISQIADVFYSAGVQYANLTGFSASMTSEDICQCGLS